MLKKQINKNFNSINSDDEYIGETIENKVRRVTENNEPITDGAPIIYMERKDGVNPSFDIRTDRWDMALDAADIVAKAKMAKRIERHKPIEQVQGTGGEPAA